MKNKKIIAPNECSLFRWILVLAVGFLVATAVILPLNFLSYLTNRTDTFMGITYADIFSVLMFVPLFIATAISIRLLAKTPLKDFILGVNGKINKKESLIIFALYAGGMLIPWLITAGNVRLRGVTAGNFAFLVLFSLLLVWMQTTWEEFVFRGFLIRWACKNDVRFTKKSLIAAVISSVIFMLAHMENPEITSQSGFDVVIISASYFISGFVCFAADLHFGSLIPCMIVHWINNFVLLTVISQEVSAVTNPTLLIDSTPKTALWDVLSTVLVYLPLTVFIVWDIVKHRKAKPAKEQ